MPSESTTPNGKMCATPDCGRPLRARGFCVACYYRHLRRGDVTAGTQTGRWLHRLSDVDADARTATCAECGPVKVLARDGGARFRCAVAANHRAKLYKRAYRASKKAMLLSACEICGTSERLCWDHDHGTGEFRGTLCDNCNSGIGFMADDPKRLRKAARYVERDKARQMNAASLFEA